MAKGSVNVSAQCEELLGKIRSGEFSPVYLLMGDEPFYTDRLCTAIIENALDDFSRDFNETICYGADVDADTIITAARRFPMMAERQLVVVKDAQAMRDLEQLAVYCENPLDSTILVILMRGSSADKRKALYKQCSKNGVVVESNALRDYEMASWISSYFQERGLSIAPDAAALLAEYSGTNMSKIVVETDKLLKNLPEGMKSVSASDIEKNVGISRQYSVFELTKELSYRNGGKALAIAARLGESPRFAMPMAISALYTHFVRILKYGALKEKERYPDRSSVSAALQGVNPYFWKEYDAAVSNYPLRKAMAAISLLCEYDYKGKGVDAGESTPGELLTELVLKLLNI
ncbi:MAG: DNA polymerase III subunit delta [Bacteroidales bacterium]|nr:DNA polymerase III subunit delta [Bacteroidales bacterium]